VNISAPQQTLERYYRVNQLHLQWSFWLSLAALVVGLCALLAGVALVFRGQDALVTSITTIGGVLTQFIGAGFFFLYSRNLKQLNIFNEQLVKLQDTNYAIGFVQHLPEDRRAQTFETIISMLITRNEPKSPMTPELVRAYADAMHTSIK
jgi:hypothetical protein